MSPKEEKSFAAEALASELHMGSLTWPEFLINFVLTDTMTKRELPDWEMVLSATAKLQQVLPEAVLTFKNYQVKALTCDQRF